MASPKGELRASGGAAAAGEDTLLGEGAHFEGKLVLPRAGRIEGSLRGEVLARGPLRIGPAGVVEADLEASRVIVEGRVRGNLRASESISLGPAAVVQGNLAAPRLAVAEGARIDGQCRCGGAEAPLAPPPALAQGAAGRGAEPREGPAREGGDAS